MLNPDKLKSELQKAFEEVLPNAFEQALVQTFPEKTEEGSKKAKQFGETITEMLSEDLATRIAGAIDFYVKNISISGLIITMGSPFTQTANINSPSPVTNGLVPNSLKIS